MPPESSLQSSRPSGEPQGHGGFSWKPQYPRASQMAGPRPETCFLPLDRTCAELPSGQGVGQRSRGYGLIWKRL